MVQVTVADDTYERVLAFKSVVEAVLDEQLELGVYVELLLLQAIDTMLTDLLPAEPSALLASLQQLAARYPAEVYGFVAEALKAGAVESERREEMQKRLRIGFRPTEPGTDG
jgi:hypothetical protein